MAFANIIETDDEVDSKPKKLKVIQPRKSTVDHRGCDSCTLDKVKGVQKIFGKVRGRKIFIWAQSPGPQENRDKKELIGAAGEFLWRHMKAAGITRDMCDIQNVVRCFPADREDGHLMMRNPTDAEIKCCSVYNEEALQKSEARVHLVFGQVAARALFGKNYKKDKRVFWSDKFKGKVFLLDHPSYFNRGGGQGARLSEWKRALKLAARTAKVKGGRYSSLHAQEYIGVETVELAKRAYKEIKKDGYAKVRVSSDLEAGIFDDKGKPLYELGNVEYSHKPLVTGFCSRPGKSWVFPHWHYGGRFQSKFLKYCRKIVRRLLEDAKIRKIFHHGNYDVPEFRRVFGIKVKGYDYDTNYAEYFNDCNNRSYSLQNITNRKFPEFTDYKSVTAPEAIRRDWFKAHYPKADYKAFLKGTLPAKTTIEQVYEKCRYEGGLNYALVPWKKMVLYNGADNDMQKRIEMSHDPKRVPLPLLRVYMNCAFVLHDMERNGPWLDYKQHKVLRKIYPVRLKRLLKKLRKMAKDKEFNPDSPQQVSKIIYGKLKLPIIGKTPNTRAETLEILAQKHPFAKLLGEYRKLSKAEGTYIKGYKYCADHNNKRLRTSFWSTGTRTGRLSSGGSRNEVQADVVNLQNIHGSEWIQNLLVSDIKWRKVYRYWLKHGPFKSIEEIPDWILDTEIFLGLDFAQQELRQVAEESGDKELIKIFSSGGDPHSLVGHALTGWPVKRIKKDPKTRRVIKNMQFGMVFGLSEDNLIPYMRAKGVTEEDASDAKIRKYYRKYFKRFSGVRRLQAYFRKFVEEHGFIRNQFGFTRDLDLTGEDEHQGGFWGNIAVNTPIQGASHQLLMMGMQMLKVKPHKYHLLKKRAKMEIHDALYFGVTLRTLFKAAVQARYILEDEPIQVLKHKFHIKRNVPLLAEPKAGYRFGVIIEIMEDGKFKYKGEDAVAMFLNDWCKENKASNKRLRKELAKAA